MSNNSGVQRTVINTRERAVSTDINLLQSRGNRDHMTLLSRATNDIYSRAGSVGRGTAIVSTDGSAINGCDLYGGLDLEIFSTHVLLSPGVIGAKAQPGDYDSSKDSDYVLVNDPGVTDAGVLPFSANGNGVDIIECQVVDTVFTTESRDIYDPLTGLFTASLVTKAAGAQLTYRIRQSGSWPGTANGWFPLYVGIQAAGAASNNDVDFYDVRPLVHERNSGSIRQQYEEEQSLGVEMMWSIDETNPGVYEINGRYYDPSGAGGGSTVDASNDSNGYELRGQIVQTLPGTANDSDTDELGIKLTDADYYTPGTSPTPGTQRWVYVITVQPGNLPRWVRYKDANAGVRSLSRNRGLIVLADSADVSVSAEGVVRGITMPTAYDLGLSSQTGRVIAIARQNSDGTFQELYCAQDGWIHTEDNDIWSGPTAVESVNGDILQFQVNVGPPGHASEYLPQGAISVRGECTVGYTTPAASRIELTTETTTNGTIDSGTVTGRRRQSYGQLPIGTDATFYHFTEFNWPSESMQNSGSTSGGFSDLWFQYEAEFPDTTPTHDVTSDSFTCTSLQVEWA